MDFGINMEQVMFFDEDDKLFGGTPRSKFMDIVFNANRTLVENELENLIKKNIILEIMLENSGHLEKDLDRYIRNYEIEHQDVVESRKTDMFIELVGNILTNNE